MHIQSVRDFPQTKLDSEINSPPIFFHVFAKNSLIKNIFEEEKSLIVEHIFFLENSFQLGVFCLRRGLQANHGTV